MLSETACSDLIMNSCHFLVPSQVIVYVNITSSKVMHAVEICCGSL